MILYHAITCLDDVCDPSCPIGDPSRPGGVDYEQDPNLDAWWADLRPRMEAATSMYDPLNPTGLPGA